MHPCWITPSICRAIRSRPTRRCPATRNPVVTKSGDTVTVDYYAAGSTPTVTFTIAATDGRRRSLGLLSGRRAGQREHRVFRQHATITPGPHDAATSPPAVTIFMSPVIDNGATPLSDDFVYHVVTVDTTADHTPQFSDVTLPDDFVNDGSCRNLSMV